VPDYRSISMCYADRDGDCYHKRCPQTRDGEPFATGRHCPLDRIDSDTHTREDAIRLARQIMRAPKRSSAE
jgi:hypothetical protein